LKITKGRKEGRNKRPIERTNKEKKGRKEEKEGIKNRRTMDRRNGCKE
jgi:hypothetical protein